MADRYGPLNVGRIVERRLNEIFDLMARRITS